MIEVSGSSIVDSEPAEALVALDPAAAPLDGPALNLDAAGSGKSPGSRPNEVREKVRIRFRKFDGLRFIGHNDLLRCFHRLIRRTGLKIRHSQGFHPMPRISSPLALPLGVVGCEEVLEFEFEDDLPLETIRLKIAEQTVPGLEVVGMERLPTSTRTEVVEVEYACELPEEIDADAIGKSIQLLLDSATYPVARRTPGKPERQVDLRQWVRTAELSDRQLRFVIAVTNGTTARPEELLTAIGLDGLTADGAIVRRSRVRLKGE